MHHLDPTQEFVQVDGVFVAGLAMRHALQLLPCYLFLTIPADVWSLGSRRVGVQLLHGQDRFQLHVVSRNVDHYKLADFEPHLGLHVESTRIAGVETGVGVHARRDQ
jgi:hypothetical protein